VYFLYPETAGKRLEEMHEIFGDATTAMPTPATIAERSGLMGPTRIGSPIPSLDIRGTGVGNAIPGLDINPPVVDIQNGKPQFTKDDSRSEGVGGWISKMVSRAKGSGNGSGKSGRYKQLDQEEG
jgi:hypothetical protein